MPTKYTSLFFLLFCIGVASESSAQQSWFRMDSTVAVSAKGAKLVNPWAGGLNASQFLKMHLDNDTTEDLVVFDRTNSKVTTFIASANPADASKKIFIHAPYYEQLFPKVDNWMILADYNGDGLKDLFASTSLGITVYKQIKTGTVWSWKLQRDALNTQGFSTDLNLQVSGPDIPGIIDIDGDGDLDILTFDFSGTNIELHQNLSMEKYGVPDSLGRAKAPVFMRNGDCWGNFHKGDGEDFVFGAACGVVDNSGGRVMHAGNSILLQDLDGDGKRDLLVGHVSNEHISFLKNSANGLIANFTSYTNTYPAVSPVSFYIFPAAFMEDVDFDGIKDLIVAPSVSTNDGNLVDFKSSNWLYHNAGTTNNPNFQLLQKNFLQDQMIDVGENAAPSFFDIDGDGDLDMVIGTGGIQGTSGFRGGFWLLKNTGTNKNPQYEVSSENYLEVPGTLGLYNLKPQWADFNGDGVPDLGFAGVSTSGIKPEFRYIPNKAAKGAAVQLNIADAVLLTMPSEAQIGDNPFFYDTDGDGDLDLIVGKPLGNIYYYTNTGSNKQFTFKLETDTFAGVGLNFEGRFVHAVAEDVDLDGRPDLLTVDHTGTMRLFYGAAWGKWTTRESLLVDFNGKGSAPVLGRYLTTAVADYNGDGKPDVAVGTNAGGLRLLTNILPITITGTEPTIDNEVKVFPNPASDYIKVLSSIKGSLRILNITGLTIRQSLQVKANEEFEVSTLNWVPGLYLFELQSGASRTVKKVVIK
ncbi:T9SS type A sorting domain-containing protein [Dyadobacter psychrotolerans]|uniref:T9SS type A sorting domain-containing protein n=2 Tax=Dyadobacter psychrotolerans TaxID=2541721 RepID=A0A4R5DGQ2_9BACT|nr:T9SS type A sorting domain-containing protein [Dyadobacter psychrotolerans]